MMKISYLPLLISYQEKSVVLHEMRVMLNTWNQLDTVRQ